MKLRHKSLNLHITLNLTALTHKGLCDMGDNVCKMAPASVIYAQNPAIQTSVTNLSGDVTALKTADSSVLKLEADLELARRTRDTARTSCEKGMTVVRQQTEHAALTVEDAASLGFTARIGGTPPAPLAPPSSITVKLGKKHGEFHATAVSTLRGKWDLEVSADPITPTSWSGVPGSAKGRRVTGHASGTLVWVRMRMVRAQATSDWCAPVPVTVP